MTSDFREEAERLLKEIDSAFDVLPSQTIELPPGSPLAPSGDLLRVGRTPAVRLRDPEQCQTCRRKTRAVVIDSRLRGGGYRRRLIQCRDCGTTWATFESLIDPKAIVQSLPEWARGEYLE